MAYFQEKVRKLLGERVWFILTDCITDNAWISYLIWLAVFPRSEPFKTLDLSLTVFKEFFTICGCATIVRILVVKGLPSTKNYIATRSIIYGNEHKGVLVDNKPVDLEEGRNGMVATAVADWGQSDFVETLTREQRVPLYERLLDFFRPTPEKQAVRGNQNVDVEALELDFQRCPRIPNVLHNDDIFRRFICPITHHPIRDPVRDPINNQTLYERSAIVNWLSVHHHSPMTRRPLEANQLIEAPGVKAVIDQRLDYHRRGLLNYIEEHLQVPIPAPDQLLINQNQ